MRGRISVVVTVLVALALLAALPAGAALRSGLSFRLDCDGFVSRGGGIVMNRDNTGSGRETIVITGYDGNGSVIFGPVDNTAFVGSSLFLDDGMTFRWGAAPAANPLILLVTSAAGNGFDEQRVYSAAGLCTTLPTVDLPDGALLPSDGLTAPSVPINAAPPRPANQPGAVQTLDGYAIVNTPVANLRSGDSVRYTVVANVVGGAELIVLGRNGDDSWWYVQAGDVRGWINNELVLLRGDLSAVPLVPVLGEIQRPTLFIHVPQILYTAPGGSVLCVIEPNKEYYITRRTRSEPVWYELEATCDGQVVYGWILGDNGSFRNPAGVSIAFR